MPTYIYKSGPSSGGWPSMDKTPMVFAIVDAESKGRAVKLLQARSDVTGSRVCVDDITEVVDQVVFLDSE